MRIECANRGTRSIFDPAITDAKVVFDKRGRATVTETVGKALARKYPAVVIVKARPAKRARPSGKVSNNGPRSGNKESKN